MILTVIGYSTVFLITFTLSLRAVYFFKSNTDPLQTFKPWWVANQEIADFQKKMCDLG